LFNTPWTAHTVDAVHSFAEHVYAQRLNTSKAESS